MLEQRIKLYEQRIKIGKEMIKSAIDDDMEDRAIQHLLIIHQRQKAILRELKYIKSH